ncbi:MAG TPA: hypothetical protein VLU25_20485 [Acidobacteriota bacterium]|nr:hypothetical protein [Acidobacteriota bacterium]
MIVKLKQQQPDYPDLTLDQPYLVIGIESDDFRLLNDSGQPFLYPSELFLVADHSEPNDWVSEVGEDGERYAYPHQLNLPGFFEDFFEGRPQAVKSFWQVVNRRLALAADVA